LLNGMVGTGIDALCNAFGMGCTKRTVNIIALHHTPDP